jgi:Family of unknown function (DUF5682)
VVAPPSSALSEQSDEIAAISQSLIADELIVFPVRHHSPASAWHLDRLIAEKKPSVLLVEGPTSFTPLIPLLTHTEARFPLAIYTYAVFAPTEKDNADIAAGKPGKAETLEKADMARRAAYYPFCEYSPELVGLRAAAKSGIEARFIDLDFADQCAIEAEEDESPRDGNFDQHSLLSEERYRKSRYLSALATQMGCRNHEELWEHLFEIPATTQSTDAHVASVVAYCHLARIECSHDELTRDGTLAREAEMAWHIGDAIKRRTAGDGPVLAVVGGFHAVVLPQVVAASIEKNTKRPMPAKGARKAEDAASALIRYSFDRLDRLNGYASGMTSPVWHQRIWDIWNRARLSDRANVDASVRARRDVVLTLLFDIAIELREKHKLPIPMPAMAAAYEQALKLAGLRNRMAPAREDLTDAIISCFVKGEADADGAIVLATTRRMLSGNTMGKVPPGAQTPPLVRDVEYRLRRQRLKIDEAEPRRSVLDIYRRPEHRVTSRLFHGLNLLAVPMATRTAGPDFVRGSGLDKLQEHWEYLYSASTEAALVEASVYGTTLPLAVANRFVARVEHFESSSATHANGAAALLVEACLLGLHDHLAGLVAILARAIASDPEFVSVVAAVSTTALLWESREPLEARDVEAIPIVLQAAYERAIYLARGMQAVPDDASSTISALMRLRETLTSLAGQTLDDSLYWTMVETLQRESMVAAIRGAATGLLYCTERIADAELATMVDGNLGGLRGPQDAVAFLRGVLQTAREVAWQQRDLLRMIDLRLRDWGEDTFVRLLPELRLAFSEMTPKETDRIAEAVAKLNDANDLGKLVHYDLSVEELQVNIAIAQKMREVISSDGLSQWVSP